MSLENLPLAISQGYYREWVISPSILLSHMDGCKKRQLSKRQYVEEEKLMSPFKALQPVQPGYDLNDSAV